jgi:hypothetical protein
MCLVIACVSQPQVSEVDTPDTLGRKFYRVVTSTCDKVVSSAADVVWSGESEPIFPPALKTQTARASALFAGRHVVWHVPTTLSDLLRIQQEHPTCRIIAGNSEVHIETKFKGALAPHRVTAQFVQGFSDISIMRPSPLATVSDAAHAVQLSPHVAIPVVPGENKDLLDGDGECCPCIPCASVALTLTLTATPTQTPRADVCCCVVCYHQSRGCERWRTRCSAAVWW